MANLFADNRFNAVFLQTLHVGTGTTYALWEKGGGVIAGRFRVDPWEVPTGGINPGIGEIQTWFYCDRRIVPPPLPELGDHLTIRDQVWEIVQRDEDDIGELGYRLSKQELGLIFPEKETGEGDWDDKQTLWDQTVPSGPSRWDRTPPPQGDWDKTVPGGPSRWDGGSSIWDQGITGPEAGSDWDKTVPGGPSRWDGGQSAWDQGVSGRRGRGRPTREPEIAQAYDEAATAGVIGPDMPMPEVVQTVRSRISGSDRRGLGDKTMRRVIQKRK